MTDTTEELFDVVNEHDEVIGQASRSECHSNPKLIHHVVHFTLVDENTHKILITQRSLKKDHDAGRYCFLGEHILAGESYIDAVTRGVKEELGFTPKRFIECAKTIFKYDQQTELVKFYVIYWAGETIQFDKLEMENIAWTDYRSLLKNINIYPKIAAFWINNINWNKILNQ